MQRSGFQHKWETMLTQKQSYIMQVDSPNSNTVVLAQAEDETLYPPKMVTSVSVGVTVKAAALCPHLAWSSGTMTCMHMYFTTLFLHRYPPHYYTLHWSSDCSYNSRPITTERCLIILSRGMAWVGNNQSTGYHWVSMRGTFPNLNGTLFDVQLSACCSQTFRQQ